ncbi:MAG TPA: ribulokinase [Fimbriimonadaceae bacterium]|nr:ribulokinase [Fimbriimonadaceae bacterium]
MPQVVLGLDYGTNSVRALLVDTHSGEELATSVFDYPSGEAGILLDPRDPNLARQNPADYIGGFVETVRAVLRGMDPSQIVGIGVDTTGSSPIPVDARNRPLSEDARFAGNLAANCWLWKDHTSHAESAEITRVASERGEPYLAKCGGTYSSEWFWSKILHCARTSPDVFEAAHSWVECCDWITSQLAGIADPAQIVRSVCAAGHKAMYAVEWGGLPSKDFLATLDPRLAELRDRLYDVAVPSDQVAGTLTEEMATKVGLNPGIPIAVGGFDAHFGAVASGVRPGVFVKIIGTSTCDCLVHPKDEPLADIPGLCGIVDGSVLPGYYGLEAGQSAVGDIFNWVVRFTGRSHEELSADASGLRAGESGLLSLDWNNGNRTVLVDPLLTGLVLGQTLHTKPAELYRAAIEATAFGALKIIRRVEEYGVRVDEVVACGGIADKSDLVMQIYANVFNRPVKISQSTQTCALGSAIFASVVAGVHKDAQSAQEVMVVKPSRVFAPDPTEATTYATLYRLYQDLHDAFGSVKWQGNLAHVMKQLIQIRDEVRRG